MEGPLVESDMEFDVYSGRWNWIGYPFNEAHPVEIALSEIAGMIEIVMTDDGRMWAPGLGVNTLGDMLPGEGYSVYPSEDLTFTYTQEEYLRIAGGTTDVWEIPEVADSPRPTGLPYAVIVRLSDELKMHDPAVIELYDGDLLVGKAAVLQDRSLTPVIAWSRDEARGLAGFRSGNDISIRLLRANGTAISTISDERLSFGEELMRM